ncbi:hypothetical protein [Mycolicibacter sinensis]|uniref:Uncharacterized protein n=1 Tax=Mycolicibacter sinensis (strain JDM601) TaxID=875328 RepID=A0A1A3U6K1_MYCSD|nr:hypothetical protein [Mycolicibacter sinensis]OBK90548.1 hypothetical protein A5648_16855 [Mycolicibacter sinensis]
MLIMGVLCLLAAVASLVFGVRTLARPLTGDPEQLVLRAVAPAQVAVGVILAVGGALAAQPQPGPQPTSSLGALSPQPQPDPQPPEPAASDWRAA